MEVLRSGPPDMDAGRAVLGQGWLVTACPRSVPARGTPERSEGRTPGQGLFAYFCGGPTLGCLTKVSRRKGGTRRKPWRIDGYVLGMNNCNTGHISAIHAQLEWGHSRCLHIPLTTAKAKTITRFETTPFYVGASLLAKQATRSFWQTPVMPSRAGSLPQRIGGVTDPDTKQTGCRLGRL